MADQPSQEVPIRIAGLEVGRAILEVVNGEVRIRNARITDPQASKALFGPVTEDFSMTEPPD